MDRLPFEIETVNSKSEFELHQEIGLLPLGPGAVPVVDFDDLSSSGRPGSPQSALDLVDGFEQGIDFGWSRPTSPSRMKLVTGREVLSGDASLAFTVRPPDRRTGCRDRLERNLRSPTDLFGARWSFAARTGNKRSFRLAMFVGYAPDGTAPVGVLFGRSRIGPYLRLWAMEDGRPVLAPPVPIDDHPRSVTLRWERAAGDKAPTGSARLWINGTEVAALTGLDNHGYQVDGYGVGALCLGGRPNARILLDDFEAWVEH